MSKRFHYLLMASAGGLCTLAYAPFSLWPVVFVCFALAVRQLRRLRQRPFLAGWLFGLGWFGAGVSWVHVSIADYGGLPLIGSIALMLLLCGYLSLYPALAFYATARWFKPAHYPLALPFLWLISEWIRSWMLTGFPWLSLGYSQIDSPLAGWFPVIGETGVTALIVMTGAAFAATENKRSLLSPILVSAIVLLSGAILKDHNWVTTNRTVSMAMVQGNIAQSLRWQPEQDLPTMMRYETMTQSLWSSDIIIWPEAAVPKIEPLAVDYLTKIDNQARSNHSALITGIVNYNWESDEAFNSVIVLGNKTPDGQSGQYQYYHNNRYSKHHLLPVGEFVPFEDLLRGLAPIFDLPMSSFSRGDFVQQNIIASGVRLAPALCFEIAFPRQVGANINRQTDAIITLSNDAWFGKSHGPAQHLEIARVRALEFGKPVIRSTNNGISAFIDHTGAITARLPQFETASLQAPVVLTKGSTPYHRYGDFIVLLFTGLLIVSALVMKRSPQQD